MRQKPEEESEENLFQKILRPENCPGLSKITVNQVMWDRVSAEARTGDVKMQRVQSALVKGTTNAGSFNSRSCPEELKGQGQHRHHCFV